MNSTASFPHRNSGALSPAGYSGPPVRPIIDPASVRRILVCQLRQIGDVLLATPALELLHRHFPDAEVHVLTERKCTPMLQGNPAVHTVWAIDKKDLSSLAREVAFYWRVARTGFDVVVDFQQLPRCRWVVAMSRARVRLSYTPAWYNRWLFTHWVRPRDGYAAMAKASVLEPLGVRWNGERPRLYLSDAERDAASGMLATLGLAPGQRLITVDPTHRRITRRWPADHYGRLLSLAAARDPSLRFMPLFGPGEEDDVRAVVAACDCPEKVLMPDRMLSLREMAACIDQAVLHVGNCSAPCHIAVAVGTPTFVVRGATSKAWSFPAPEHFHMALGLDCQPCNRNECANPDQLACLVRLTPEAVCQAMLDHLDSVSR